jgi:S1-C subfamily serine protease
LVKQVVRQLAEKGTISRGYLGVHLATALEPADALRLGLDKARGALVESVYPETPAAIAGVKANDVVLQVDSVAIRNENHLINLIAGLSPGQRIRLHIWREKKTETIEAIVGDWNVAQAKLRAER